MDGDYYSYWGAVYKEGTAALANNNSLFVLVALSVLKWMISS